MPVVVISSDPVHAFCERCQIILANLGGCAARSPRPILIGSAVHLNGLPSRLRVAARVINCISLGKFENQWLLGLALDEPGNVWGIENAPQDWQE
jgi:hypothetical protein